MIITARMASGSLKGAAEPRSVARPSSVLSCPQEGQKLWLLGREATDGPIGTFNLIASAFCHRLYGLSSQSTAVKLNPFSRGARTSRLIKACVPPVWSIVNDLVGAMVIDPKALLTRSVEQDALAASSSEQEFQGSGAMPHLRDRGFGPGENKWTDPAFRNQKLNEWIHFAREQISLR